jgi:hypothetical protein
MAMLRVACCGWQSTAVVAAVGRAAAQQCVVGGNLVFGMKLLRLGSRGLLFETVPLDRATFLCLTVLWSDGGGGCGGWCMLKSPIVARSVRMTLCYACLGGGLVWWHELVRVVCCQ